MTRTTRRPAPAPPAPAVWGLVAALIAATLIAYHNSFSGAFIFDDLPGITANKSITSLSTVFSTPGDTPVTGRPLVNLSLALNYALGGFDVAGYHVVNLLAHVLAVLLMFGFVRRALVSPRLELRYGRDAAPIAFAIALLWGVHPLQTESVDYLIQRTELFMGLFFLLTLYCVQRGAASDASSSRRDPESRPQPPSSRRDPESGPLPSSSRRDPESRPQPPSSRRDPESRPLPSSSRRDPESRPQPPSSRRDPESRPLPSSSRRKPGSRVLLWYAAAVVAGWLGMASKEILIVMPLVVLAYDRLFLAGSFRAALRDRRWLYAGLATVWVVFLLLAGRRFHMDVSVNDPSKMAPTAGASWNPQVGWLNLKTQAGVILLYVRLALWPSPLIGAYGDVHAAGSLLSVLPAASCIALLLGLTVWGVIRGAPLAFLGVWFFLILAPTSSIWPLANEIAAERRMYLPLAAIVTLVVLAVHAVLQRAPISARAGNTASYAALGICSVAFMATTIRRNEDYRTSGTFWAHVVAERPAYARAHLALGNDLISRGQNAAAIQQLRTAIQLAPEDAVPYHDLGVVYFKSGMLDSAIAEYRESLRITPGFGRGHLDLGGALAAAGKDSAAAAEYEIALRQDSTNVALQMMLAGTLVRQGRAEEAIGHYRSAIRLAPQTPEIHNDLAVTLANLGRLAEAIPEFQESFRLAPTTAAAANLGNALKAAGRTDEARAYLGR